MINFFAAIGVVTVCVVIITLVEWTALTILDNLIVKEPTPETETPTDPDKCPHETNCTYYPDGCGKCTDKYP